MLLNSRKAQTIQLQLAQPRPLLITRALKHKPLKAVKRKTEKLCSLRLRKHAHIAYLCLKSHTLIYYTSRCTWKRDGQSVIRATMLLITMPLIARYNALLSVRNHATRAAARSARNYIAAPSWFRITAVSTRLC